MDISSLKLLHFLKDNGGLHNKTSIAPLVDELFPEGLNFSESQYKLKPLFHVIASLEKDGFIKNLENPSPNGNSYTWDTKKSIQMELTTTGDSYLKDNLHKETEFEVNRLTIDGHELTQMVHKSVIDTNRKMVDIAKEQAESNSVIATNSAIQTGILDRQKWVLWATVFIAACSALISYFNYHTTASNSQSTQELKGINKRIDTLQKELLQIKTASRATPKNVSSYHPPQNRVKH